MEEYLLPAAAAVAATTALGAYLDAKFHLQKDLTTIYSRKQGQKNWANAVARGEASAFYLLQKAARKYSQHEAIWSREGVYSWQVVYDRACQYGQYFLSLGVQPAEYVGIYLLNSPDFLCIWFGLLSIGAAPALINNSLVHDALLHCVAIPKTKFLLVDSEEGCQSRIGAAADKLQNDLGIQILVHDDTLKRHIAQFPRTQPPRELIASLGAKTPYAIMYTSGTTGLPKAFPMPMVHFYSGGSLESRTYGQIPGPNGDKVYYCMPLFHGTSGLTAMTDLMGGISIAIGKKFSVSRFWIDCIDSKATILVYVGETARYLLSAPPSPNDRRHQVRMMMGNGIQGEVWLKFKERFGIKELAEFYASTEGLFITNNHSRSGIGLGAAGHHGAIIRYMNNNTVVPVKIDADTGEMWRDPTTGFAKRQDYNDGGEILVKLPSEEAWVGYYRAKEASEKKVARNVFRKGDLYWRTGDSMRRDDDGFWYFMDRLGDTYRWKGENVSTTEVSNAFGSFPGIHEANVYGVTLPFHEGRAGCATVVLEPGVQKNFSWSALLQHLQTKLPRYAIPIFIRLAKVDVGGMSTATNKQVKTALRFEGVDPELRGTKVTGGSDDEILWLPLGSNTYIPFEIKDWQKLQARELKL